MFAPLGHLIVRYWWAFIIGWILLAVFCVSQAPRWEDVTYDGDLAYLPADTSTVRAERLLDAAFPDSRGRSQVAIILARDDARLTSDDNVFADRLAKHLLNLCGTAGIRRYRDLFASGQSARQAGDEAEALDWDRRASKERDAALDALDSAVDLDRSFAPSLHNRALVLEALGRGDEAEQDRVRAWEMNSELADHQGRPVPDYKEIMTLRSVWFSGTPIMGSKLVSPHGNARLIVLQLSSEFMATENIALLERVEQVIDEVRADTPPTAGLDIGLSGSAAVGGDMLRSAAESIKHTERYTVLFILAILLVVYRAPLLITVPIITISVSLVVAIRLLAWLTQVHLLPGMEWWDFKVFTTTKIFIVVILFGAGTDYCLFLIARYREELEHQQERSVALRNALSGVGDALAASALTTILGLGTMFFAEFGKFRNSGPAIGFCLFVTLLACLTLAPAMLQAMGHVIFWPQPRTRLPLNVGASASERRTVWHTLAGWIVDYPGRVLILATAAMLPMALAGCDVAVTYDFLSELEPSRPSKIGSDLLRRHFPIGESGPIVVLAKKTDGGFNTAQGETEIGLLTEQLRIDGVAAVRSLTQPMGAKPKRQSVFRPQTLVARNLPLIRALYLSDVPSLEGDVTRFELICDYDPFSNEAAEVLSRVEGLLAETATRQDSFWVGSEYLVSGTTAGIRDLQTVTRADNLRIQILVVLAVLAVLLMILRRPFVCIYMIASVLFSYLVTIGATELFFRYAYADTFQGLDWKVPLFLFVILVAIGQDYNIYLATRVFEEQTNLGMIPGLKHAVVRTGGIITSCGVIMAGTFVSMTTGSLRGIVELGLALSLGVILDTFVVRPILLPAFLSILFRRQQKSQPPPPHKDLLIRGASTAKSDGSVTIKA